MGLLFLILMLVAICFFVLGKKSGAILALAAVFSDMAGIILEAAGIEGINMLFRYLLFLIVIVMNIDRLKCGIRRLIADSTSIMLYAVIITMLVLNLYVVGRARNDSDVADFQLNVILRVLIPYIVVILALTDKKIVKDFCMSFLVWGGLFFATFFLLIGMDGVVIEDRMTLEEATGIGPIELSRFAGIILMSCLGFLLGAKTRIQPLFIAMILIGLFLLFLSSQRGTILGVLVSVMVFLYFNLAKKGHPGTLVIVAGFLLIIVYLFLEQFHFSFLSRFKELEDIEESNRYLDYGFSWAAFSQNHFFWGLGSRGYFYFMDELREYPHSFILEQMVEYGIVGLCFAVVLIVQSVKCCIRLFRNSLCPDFIKIVPAMWIVLLFSVLVSGNFLSNAQFFVTTAALLAVYYCYKDDYESQESVVHKRT
ncbi:MAG: O-antigen ligase family protein [Bacteroidales bacterium]|nr:O-antigen ligase family protein [Bacteroidales bacterium]